MNRLRLALLALFLVAALSPGRATSRFSDFEFYPGSGIEMRATSFYDEFPPAGFLPVRLEVRNRSASARTWEVRSSHSFGDQRDMRFVTTISVDAQSERSFDLLLPLATQNNAYGRYADLEITISGYGVSRGTATEHSSVGGGSPTAFFGMGESLSVKNWGPLRDLLTKKYSRSLDGTSINVEFLPEDWRGLSGFNLLILTDDEWRRIPPGPRGAVFDWIAQGGSLVLCHEGDVAASDLPAAGNFGSGSVAHWPLGDDLLDRVAQITEPGRLPSLANAVTSDYNWSWPLALLVGQPSPPRVLIIVFVIIFAVVIGPLNFAIFAPPGNRHRLFWTTPLISLVATALMGVFILLSEGVGGRGERFTVLLSLPSQHKTAIWQEQMSRTGVLLGNTFTLKEPALLLPVSLRQDSDPYAYRRPSGGIARWFLDGSTWSGDWFRSRSAQAQLLAAVIPSRAELAIAPGAPPAAISSFEQEFKDLWYFDETGAVWRTEAVRPGEKKTLAPAQERDFQKWLQAVLESAGPVTKSRTHAFLRDRKGKFFASTDAPASLSTLKAIRWHDAGALVFGETTR